jgi:hypothetical protein
MPERHKFGQTSEYTFYETIYHGGDNIGQTLKAEFTCQVCGKKETRYKEELDSYYKKFQ